MCDVIVCLDLVYSNMKNKLIANTVVWKLQVYKTLSIHQTPEIGLVH